MRTIAGITDDVGERDVLAEQPRPAARLDRLVHALVGAAQAVERGVHLLLRKAACAPSPA